MNRKIIDQLNKLSIKELKILKIAISALYFNDNSDYITALWRIIKLLSKDTITECNSELFDYLNKVV